MNNYRIFETEEFSKTRSKLIHPYQKLITKKLQNQIYPQLKDEPHFGKIIKKLVGYNPETWRYRVGKYRIFYIIDELERIVYLLHIELRKDAY
ncbi:MAG: type II toxin-antitoxin system RelE/ParE family toxin [Melioribacteraceae bacterium]|nr:type II toxin-antitoxin system RelE/ParE family toxin [Melioribacteraceae bacterium]